MNLIYSSKERSRMIQSISPSFYCPPYLKPAVYLSFVTEEETTMEKHPLHSPQELNQICLYSRYRFKPDSKLREYLFMKTKVKRSYYLLVEIMERLKMILRSEKLYDLKNPSIIMCDSDLEMALNMKDLHVTEIRNQILKQLTLVKQQKWLKNYRKENTFSQRASTSKATTTFDPEAEYNVKPPLMELLRTECEEKNKATFTYKEVVHLLFKYLLKRRETLFDPRNLKVVRVHEDPLGRALGGIARFHRCQVPNLLRAQLTPAVKDVTEWIKTEWIKTEDKM